MLTELLTGDTGVDVLGLLSCGTQGVSTFYTHNYTTSTNHTFSGGTPITTGSETVYSLSRADLITLYTFSLRPSFGTTSLNESGPGVEARAAHIASPSISCSIHVNNISMHVSR